MVIITITVVVTFNKTHNCKNNKVLHKKEFCSKLVIVKQGCFQYCDMTRTL